ncbi:MAG: TonB-dependent receptor [Aquabacterium sp.]
MNPSLPPLRTLSRAAATLPALLTALAPAHGQTPPPPTGATEQVVVTGNPLQRSDPTQPVSVLSGEGLALRRAGTLGQTLDGLPGVSASAFGPNASRPVIRGLDGDRVRLMDNGAATIDASNLSFDHAVAVDPLVVERIEVLRGPAALLYGGNATGGVVNTLDNRIPRLGRGWAGRAEARLGGAASERATAAVLDGGDARLAWHVDAFSRDHGDTRAPRFTPLEDGQPLATADRVRNAGARAHGGAVGASVALAGGQLGASLDSLSHDYGVTVEPDVRIRLQRRRLALAGDWAVAAGPFEHLDLKAGHTRYVHLEVEGSGEVGTTFASRGQEQRLELRQRRRGAWGGMVGVQAEQMRFSALGEEAFVPATTTRSQALFSLQEWDFGRWRLSAGARADQVRVASAGDAVDADEPRFGAAQQRRFNPLSATLGLAATLAPGWTAQASLGRTQRAPAYYELFANGVHVATGTFERGDAALGLESSRHAEAGLRWAAGATEVKAQVYATRFSRFIALEDTGEVFGDDDHDESSGLRQRPGRARALDESHVEGPFPIHAFRAVRARFAGFELEARTRVPMAGWTLEPSLLVDHTRARNLDTGEPLPRIAPLRAALALAAQRGSQRVGLRLSHQAAQGRVPATDTTTPRARWLDLWWSLALPQPGGGGLNFTLKLDNATDALVFNPTAVQTIRGLSPRGGRALVGSVRWVF